MSASVTANGNHVTYDIAALGNLCTIETFFRFPVVPGAITVRTITSSDNGIVFVRIFAQNGNALISGTDTATLGPISNGVWYYAAAVYSGLLVPITGYFAQVGSALSTVSTLVPFVGFPSSSLRVFNNLGNNAFMNGEQVAVRIYSKALSAAEITNNYRGGLRPKLFDQIFSWNPMLGAASGAVDWSDRNTPVLAGALTSSVEMPATPWSGAQLLM